jgi:hypothetical protein
MRFLPFVCFFAACTFPVRVEMQAVTPPPVQTEFLQAFTSTFARSDLTEIASEKTPSVQWIKDVMERQGIAFNATALRKLSDSELLAIAMRAALTGISHWKRATGSDIILVDYQTGIPFPENMTLDLEGPRHFAISFFAVFVLQSDIT